MGLCLLFRGVCPPAARSRGPWQPWRAGSALLKGSARTYVPAGRIPGAPVGDLLAFHQAHHPLEV